MIYLKMPDGREYDVLSSPGFLFLEEKDNKESLLTIQVGEDRINSKLWA